MIYPKKHGSGLSGVLGNVRTIAHMANVLRPYFAPASLFQPPLASLSSTGNRRIAVTNQSQLQPRLQDAAVLQLTSGQLEWDFGTDFGATAPAVNPTPVGLHGGANPGLYIDSVTPTGVIVKSTDSSDNRLVHLAASETLTGE